jgi:hypothetical protein
VQYASGRSWLPARVVALLLLLSLPACRSFNVRSDWDDSVSFSGFARYHFLEPPVVEGADPFADNGLLRKRIRKAVEANLTARGFQAVADPADADFIVTYGVVMDEKLRVTGGGATAIGGYGYGRWPVGFGSVYGASDVRDYQEATLIVDFLDPSTRELVWRGWGSGFIQTRDRDRGPALFQKGVDAVLGAFPPKAGSRRAASAPKAG